MCLEGAATMVISATNGPQKLMIEFCLYSAQPKPASRMLVRLLLPLFLLPLCMPPVSAQVKHWNFGQRDRVADCVGRILKRKVLISAASSIDASACEGETAEGVMKSLAEMSLKVISNDQWVLISDKLPSAGKLIVVARVTAPELSKDQQDRLHAVLAQQTRIIPVEYALDREADGSQTVDILLQYAVTVMPGNTPEAPRMVALLHQSDRNRIIFVETHNGEFEAKWDTGELDAEKVGMEFDDVDGDGKQEIVATGERPVDYDSPKNDILAVFDVEGSELTRQEKCEAELVCPIEGVEVSFITGRVPWEIEVSQGETASNTKSTIYRLMKEKRRYVAIVPPSAKSVPKSANP
jgi:hypothetical protein